MNKIKIVISVLASLAIACLGLSKYRVKTVSFSLQDMYGRTIDSKNLVREGVPLFLEFGAAW